MSTPLVVDLSSVQGQLATIVKECMTTARSEVAKIVDETQARVAKPSDEDMTALRAQILGRPGRPMP